MSIFSPHLQTTGLIIPGIAFKFICWISKKLKILKTNISSPFMHDMYYKDEKMKMDSLLLSKG